jgi:hypothetical protein
MVTESLPELEVIQCSISKDEIENTSDFSDKRHPNVEFIEVSSELILNQHG